MITIVAGSGGALATATRVLNLAVGRGEEDALIQDNGVARALVFADSLPRSMGKTSATAQEEMDAKEAWDGQVHRIERDYAPPTRLPGRIWHPTYSWVQSNTDLFMDSFRFFLESCDRFEGIHGFVDDNMGYYAHKLLQELIDEELGSTSVKNKSLIFASHQNFVSPQSALSLATIGPIISCYSPVASDNARLDEIAAAVNIISLPHRQSRHKMDITMNLRPIMSISGSLPVTRLSISTQTGDLGLPRWKGLERQYRELTVVSVKDLTEAHRLLQAQPPSAHMLTSDIRYVSLKKQSQTEIRASLTIDDSCFEWTKSLHDSLNTRQAVDYFRRLEIEQDERVQMMEELLQSAESFNL